MPQDGQCMAGSPFGLGKLGLHEREAVCAALVIDSIWLILANHI